MHLIMSEEISYLTTLPITDRKFTDWWKEWPYAPASSSDERYRLEGDQTGSDTSN